MADIGGARWWDGGFPWWAASRALGLVTGADTLETIAVWIGMLGLDFHLDGPPELLEHVRALARRYQGALP